MRRLSAVTAGEIVMPANLSITFQRPSPLCSVVVINSQLDTIEGRIVFLCHILSVDEKTLYSEEASLSIKAGSCKKFNIKELPVNSTPLCIRFSFLQKKQWSPVLIWSPTLEPPIR